MLTIGTTEENGDIVLDFFSGSGTTGQAVLKQNREDGGRRRYIGVQFPEPLPVPESKLKTLADVGKERMRNAILKRNGARQGELDLKDELPEGFRCSSSPSQISGAGPESTRKTRMLISRSC